ncbi:MAG: DUF3604 domain-containing protein, partial [Planctomycetota bacterium]
MSTPSLPRSLACLLALALAVSAHAQQDSPGPASRKIDYSPYPTKTFPDRVFFGDTHLHTAYSTDAGMVGANVGPEDAYR